MSVSYVKSQDRYAVCPQCGPSGVGYNNYSLPGCYGGNITTLSGGPTGPWVQCDVRERLRDFYSDGVQGGTPLCRGPCNPQGDNCDCGDMTAPFATYAVNYFGTDDVYRRQPYGRVVETTGNLCVKASGCDPTRPDSDFGAFGHYVTGVSNYQEPLMILPVPGYKNAKTLESALWPGTQTPTTTAL